MSRIRGNEEFQAKVEFTTIAELYLGRRSHYVLQVILYLALQSVNLASILISCQVHFWEPVFRLMVLEYGHYPDSIVQESLCFEFHRGWGMR
jgi:hypothetical protein